MYKKKTHKGAKARCKVSKNGKVKRHKAGYRHLMASKSSNRRRHLRRGTTVSKAEEKKIRLLLTS